MALRKLLVAISVAVLCAGCAFEPSSVPVPGTSVSGATYPLHIEFASVLNLPPGAKVYADGVVVGALTGLEVITAEGAAGFVRADIEMKASVTLPRATKAELRQAAPLSDIHIALTTTDADFSSLLGPDDTIPLSQSIEPIAVEDTMASIATATGGGTFRDLQDIVRQLNTVLPDRPEETARIVGVVAEDVKDVAAHLDSVDSLLNGAAANLGTILAYSDTVDRIFTDDGVEHITDVFRSLVGVLEIFGDVSTTTRSAAWLVPLLNSLDGTATAVVPMLFSAQPLNTSSPSNMKMLVDLIQNKIIPFVQLGPKMNLAATTLSAEHGSTSTTDQTARIVATLRMIGAVR